MLRSSGGFVFGCRYFFCPYPLRKRGISARKLKVCPKEWLRILSPRDLVCVLHSLAELDARCRAIELCHEFPGRPIIDVHERRHDVSSPGKEKAACEPYDIVPARQLVKPGLAGT